MKTYGDKHFNKEILLKDYSVTEGISVGIAHWLHKAKKDFVSSIFRVNCGPFNLQADITPSQARELSALLLAHADEVEEREIEVRAA